MANQSQIHSAGLRTVPASVPPSAGGSSSLRAMAPLVFDALDVSEGTRADYKTRIALFIDSLGKTGLTGGSFLAFKRELADRRDISVATKNKYLAAARIFLKELYRRGYLPTDITANVKGFSQTKRHKKTGITEKEMAVIVTRIRELPDCPENSRLRALMALLALQGLRQVEICRLDVSDLDLTAETAMVHGKGRDDKEPVTLHPATVRALRSYLKENCVADGPLFMGRSNNSKRLTPRGLRMIIKRSLDELGIAKTVHGFRHYFTTRLIDAYKGDLLRVAAYTRHRSLEMLQVYNDGLERQRDLPRFYRTFNSLKLDPK